MAANETSVVGTVGGGDAVYNTAFDWLHHILYYVTNKQLLHKYSTGKQVIDFCIYKDHA